MIDVNDIIAQCDSIPFIHNGIIHHGIKRDHYFFNIPDTILSSQVLYTLLLTLGGNIIIDLIPAVIVYDINNVARRLTEILFQDIP